MKTLIWICLGILVALPGCGEESPQPQAPIQPTESAFDRQVRENCEAVYEAALAYHDANGRHAFDDDDLVPFLPDGQRLVNPATGEATEPMSNWDRGMVRFPEPPGATGYRMVWDPETRQRIGFLVVGREEHCDIMLSNLDSIDVYLALEEAVIENCKIVAAAADAFALDNNGVYAVGSSTVNSAGHTIQDYLPNGQLLMNPYHRIRSVPVWGAAAAGAGDTGYIAIDPNGDGIMNGYNIDGVGSNAGTTIYVLSNPPWTPEWTYQWDWTPYFCQ